MENSQNGQNKIDNSNAANGENKKFLKNIGNKLADEEEGAIKSGSLNKELEGLTKNETSTEK